MCGVWRAVDVAEKYLKIKSVRKFNETSENACCGGGGGGS